MAGPWCLAESIRARRCDLWLLSLSKDLTPLGKPERLTFDNPMNRNPAWTPGGREIVYASGTNWFFDRGLFKLQPSHAAKPERLAVAGELVGHPAISSQGNRLAYEVGEQITISGESKFRARGQSRKRP